MQQQTSAMTSSSESDPSLSAASEGEVAGAGDDAMGSLAPLTSSVLEFHVRDKNLSSRESLTSKRQDNEVASVDEAKATDREIDRNMIALSSEELYRYRASYLKNNPPSLFAAVDEFLGLGDFQDYPIKNGISGLLSSVCYNGRSYLSGLSGKQYPRHKTILRLVVTLQREALEEGEPLRNILERVEKERQRHIHPNDPFGWAFVVKYAGCEYELARLESKSLVDRKAQSPSKRSSFTRQTTLKRRGFDVAAVEPERQLRSTKAAKTETDSLPRPYVPAKSYPPKLPYVEEVALIYHDPPKDVELSPLPPPPPLPAIPTELKCRWRYDDLDKRIMRANFRGLASIPGRDSEFLRQMMQFDHMVVVCDGLLEIDASCSDSFTWTRRQIVAEMGREHVYHKFRRFRKLGDSHNYMELDGYLSMKASDYMRYLNQREAVDLAELKGEVDHSNLKFSFHCYCESCLDDNDGQCPGHVIEDVRRETIYMTDLELPTYIHRLHESFSRSFKLPQVIPGGSWCIMNSMPTSTRPFMGPNMYMSPPGGFTHLHQDGHGSVDSGHLCIDGYNEVLIMRRLPERHKINAVEIMNRTVGGKFSPLYNLPHDDKNEKPPWMTMQTIYEWEEMNYVPIRLVLEPGQFIHLNKGRLHAFRKGARDILPKGDCHADLRERYMQSLGLRPAPICVSIAWDWNFLGSDANGINREVASMLEAVQRCRRERVKALAPSGRAVLGLGFYLVGLHGMKDKLISSAGKPVRSPDARCQEVARGMLPSITFLIEREVASFGRALEASAYHQKMCPGRPKRGHQLSESTEPDVDKNPLNSSIDARGNDYYCILCETELANVYFRCDGCEAILHKDYLICVDCYVEGTFTRSTESNVDASHLSHAGFLSGQCKGACRKGFCMSCNVCGFGSCCSCRCHSNFTMHMRLATSKQMTDMLDSLRQIAAGDAVKYGVETMARLKYASDPGGTGHRELCRVILAHDSLNCVNVSEREKVL